MYGQKEVESDLIELIKLRASQLNGCAFCVDMHSVDMQKKGTPDRKIFAVSAWKEATFFDDRERLTLELTEAVTHIGAGGVDDDLWARANKEFGDKGLSDMILAIATINVWNRIAVATHQAPPPLES
ncbi:carboxymuconolactone decarboxylase family protein [Antrihabitans sp. YC3-6]|uniref:Carboxymuconolactone decarboxylase family protein n=2 Tax=Antrihabitans TaxID=2799491 RepID=A0A934NN51_9NOCA|nr:carboxymuconolactone decarboxylase family protein [Antrihabitans stalagmiti]